MSYNKLSPALPGTAYYCRHYLSKDGFIKYTFFSFSRSLARRRPSPKRWKWTISRARRNLMASLTSGSSDRLRNVVVGQARLLFGGQILRQVGDHVAGNADGAADQGKPDAAVG